MRASLAIVVGLLASESVWAAEPAPAPAEAAGGISGARRDFDAVKATRDKALLPKDNLPQMSVPELQLGDSEFILSQRRKKEELEREAKMKKKSANWLLEAMEQSAPKKESDSKSAEKPDELARLLAGGKQSTPEKIASAPVASAVKNEKETKKIEAPNPLNQFLTDWMTPQDYTLLKPGLQSSGTNAVALPMMETKPAGPTVSIDLSNAHNDSLGSILLPERTPAMAKPADNPYLQSFNEPAPFAGLTPPPNLPVPMMPPPISSAPSIFSPTPPLQPMAPAAKVPDFAKPLGDDKYFKPLKRF